MKYDYEFYKYSRLVADILIHPNGLEIPYDVEYDIVVAAYQRYQASCIKDEIDPYGHMVCKIEADKELYSQLLARSE